MVDGVGEEVGVEEDAVGGLEGGVVGEEHGAWDLGARTRGCGLVFWIFDVLVGLHTLLVLGRCFARSSFSCCFALRF